MAHITIVKENESYLKIGTENDSIFETMVDFFSFYVPGHRYMPKFKLGIWNGKINLLVRKTGKIYAGLLPHIQEFAKLNGYDIEYLTPDLDVEEEFSVTEADDFAKSLKLHVKREDTFIPIEAADYQLAAFRHAVQTKRTLLLSPTASGKSLIIYLL